MTKMGPGFEVPAEMRDMLEKGVTQAREGFGKVIQAVDEAANEIDKKAGSTQNKMMETHRKTLNFTEQNVAAAFDLAASLVKAKSLEDVMRLQTEYMTKQFAALRGQIQEAGHSIQAEAQSAAAEMAAGSKKMQARAKEAVDKGVAMTRDAADKVSKAATAAKAPKK